MLAPLSLWDEGFGAWYPCFNPLMPLSLKRTIKFKLKMTGVSFHPPLQKRMWKRSLSTHLPHLLSYADAFPPLEVLIELTEDTSSSCALFRRSSCFSRILLLTMKILTSTSHWYFLSSHTTTCSTICLQSSRREQMTLEATTLGASKRSLVIG